MQKTCKLTLVAFCCLLALSCCSAHAYLPTWMIPPTMCVEEVKVIETVAPVFVPLEEPVPAFLEQVPYKTLLTLVWLCVLSWVLIPTTPSWWKLLFTPFCSVLSYCMAVLSSWGVEYLLSALGVQVSHIVSVLLKSPEEFFLAALSYTLNNFHSFCLLSLGLS